MAKAVGLLPNGYCLFAKVRASLPDSTDGHPTRLRSLHGRCILWNALMA